MRARPAVRLFPFGDITLRAATLEALWQLPTGDKRLWPHLEELLDDKTPCLLGLPFIYGEIKWLAAQALAAERGERRASFGGERHASFGEAQGIMEPVYLENIVRPIYTDGISKAVLCAGVEFKWGVEGVLENLPILRDMGYLPMYDLELWPRPAQKMALATESEAKERQLELVPA